MLGHALRVAQELEVIQSRVSQLTRHLYVLISLKEGDRVRAVFERGGAYRGSCGGSEGNDRCFLLLRINDWFPIIGGKYIISGNFTIIIGCG